MSFLTPRGSPSRGTWRCRSRTDARELSDVAGVRGEGLNLTRRCLLLLLLDPVCLSDVVPGRVTDNEADLVTLPAGRIHVVTYKIVLFDLVTHILHLNENGKDKV